MIITIDGPVASGKSTIAELLAKKRGYLYLNTGLLFRAVAYLLYIKNQTLNLSALTYTYTKDNGAQILYKDHNITPLLKTPEMDQLASQVATQKEVREALLVYQRQVAKEHNVVAEGRDTGTVVFPHADYKFYITASLEERAKRWQAYQLIRRNNYTLEDSIAMVNERDTRDEQRNVAPLRIPTGAHVIDTSDMTIDDAVNACQLIINKPAV